MVVVSTRLKDGDAGNDGVPDTDNLDHDKALGEEISSIDFRCWDFCGLCGASSLALPDSI